MDKHFDSVPIKISELTELRAQLAAAQERVRELEEEGGRGCTPNCERGDYLRARLVTEKQRAERAEAALAEAQKPNADQA